MCCKRFLLFIVLIPIISSAQISPSSEKMQWWQDAKFGLFLHWGLYSATAGDWDGHPTSRGEQFMMVERIPIKKYATIADSFNPIHFDAEKWVLMAKRAGMKYIIITAKHHDGFAMYDSKASDFNIVKKTPYAKDPLKKLIEACHRNGLKFGFYYSLGRDWEDPDAATNWPVKGGRSNSWDFPDEDKKDVTRYYHRKALPQIKELVTQFGKLDILWFDTPELTPAWESRDIMDTIHKYQPACIVNSRIGNGLGDYSVYEQSIINKIMNKPWESCVTISKNWAYNRHDSAWKSANVLVRQLVDIISKGGNYLLNLSPKGDGTFAKEAVKRVDSVGQWLNINKEAVYGSRPWNVFEEIQSSPTPMKEKKVLSTAEKEALDAVNDATSKDLNPTIRFTKKGNIIYVFLCNIDANKINIKALGKSSSEEKILSIQVLGNDKKVVWNQKEDFLEIITPDNRNIVPVQVLKIILKNNTK